MDILDLGLLIFILFYIFKNAYLSIVLFALISLILQQFSKNKLLFVLLPLLIAHLFFLYNNPQEGFDIKRVLLKFKEDSKQKDRAISNLKAQVSAAEKETVVANKQTKIEKTQKKAKQRVTAQINDIASEHA
jgi:hypothetical protein